MIRRGRVEQPSEQLPPPLCRELLARAGILLIVCVWIGVHPLEEGLRALRSCALAPVVAEDDFEAEPHVGVGVALGEALVRR